jgi:SHS2 domain-containing protein
MENYEVFDHTADIGIRASGKDANEAFENAALGMFSIITDLDSVEEIGEYKIESEAQDLEQLLVNWLSELLYLQTVSSVMFAKFAVNIQKEGEKWLLRGLAEGENYDPNRHPFHTEIKAVTHHILEVNLNEICRIQVLFDI